MIKGRTIPVFIAVMVVTAAVRADMMPIPRWDTGCQQAACASDLADLPVASPAFCPFDLADFPGLGPLSGGFVPEAGTETPQVSEEQPVQLLAEGQGSLSLCLYGLLGLGVFRSASRMKRLSFTLIPDWYHGGGPFQIGHSLAIGPDLHLAPVYCFVQPECRAQDCLLQYYRGTIVSLWRKSQFTPTTLASRGPPELSNQ